MTKRYLPDHPYANLFPLLKDKELQELVEDIRKHGLREPITLFRGKVLDGRNRLRTCRRAGIKPHFTEFKGSAAAAKEFVVSANLYRRHLTPKQKRDLIWSRLRPRSPTDRSPSFQRQARPQLGAYAPSWRRQATCPDGTRGLTAWGGHSRRRRRRRAVAAADYGPPQTE